MEFPVDFFVFADGRVGLSPGYTMGGFHKSWVHSVKHRAHSNLGENAIS
jgi:hypothetical protein